MTSRGVDAAVARAHGLRAAGAAPPTDVERILAVPRVPVPADGGRGAADKWTRTLRRHADAPPLRPLQGLALDALARSAASGGPRGMFASLGVGHGKTLVTLLAGEAVCAVRPLLLVPPSMVAQLRRDVDTWSKHYHFRVPTIMAYSELSTAKSTGFLAYFRPDLVIADECHALRHRSSARTKRVVRYLQEHPDTRFCGLSGTITSKGLRDFSHLAEMSLREFSPLPLSDAPLDLWASILDPDGEPDFKALDAVWPLVLAFAPSGARASWREHTPTDRRLHARVAFRRRLATTPGAVTSTDASVASTLYLVARDVEVPSAVSDVAAGLDTSWALPDAEGHAGEGEQIADALTMARVGSQISAGFFYVWEWPGGVVDHEWLDARAAWHKAVRGTLQHSARDGYDSPLLVARACAAGEAPRDVISAWRDWKAVSDRPVPPTRAVWVDRFLVRDAVAWARAPGRGPVLLWYFTRAMETALSEAGIPCFGAGSDVPDVRRHPIAALSINVHGKGKNLQDWDQALVIEPPSSGSVWEQLIGRLHRQGQRSDVVTWHVYQHTPRVVAALETAAADAAYIEGTQGVAQRLNFGIWTDAATAERERKQNV